MIEWLEENGYDISYVSEANVSAAGGASMLEQHKIFRERRTLGILGFGSPRQPHRR